MSDLFNTALNSINNYNLINNNDHIIIGVSGGADSIALLYFLNSIKVEYNLYLTVIHINHGMRGNESDADNNFVVDFCKRLDVNVKSFYFDIYEEAKIKRLSIEETARICRYEVFNKELRELNANKIALAHNKNDNAETMLMRFYRGTGLKGLVGIPIKRDAIIRPFLNCERSLIEDYCKVKAISYRDDSTNFLEIYTRNKIRLSSIPDIQKNFNSNIINTLNNMSQNFMEEEMFLNNLAVEYLYKILVASNNSEDSNVLELKLNLKEFKNLDIVIQKRIIRIVIEDLSKTNLNNISAEHINQVIKLLDKGTGKKINLPNNLIVEMGYDILKLYIYDETKLNNYNYNYKVSIKSDLYKIIYIKEIKKYVLISEKIKDYTELKDYIELNKKDKIYRGEEEREEREEREDIEEEREDIEEDKNISNTKNVKNSDLKLEKFSIFLTKVCTIVLDYDKIDNVVFFRNKIDGDKIILNNMNKKLKKLFIDLKIPANQRSNYPVLVDRNNIIIAVLGLCIADYYNLDKVLNDLDFNKKNKKNKKKIYIYMWEDY